MCSILVLFPARMVFGLGSKLQDHCDVLAARGDGGREFSVHCSALGGAGFGQAFKGIKGRVSGTWRVFDGARHDPAQISGVPGKECGEAAAIRRQRRIAEIRRP
jgi:hypothetical protein